VKLSHKLFKVRSWCDIEENEDRGKISLQPLVLIVHTFSKSSSILDCSLFIRKIVKIVVCIINVWYKLFKNVGHDATTGFGVHVCLVQCVFYHRADIFVITLCIVG